MDRYAVSVLSLSGGEGEVSTWGRGDKFGTRTDAHGDDADADAILLSLLTNTNNEKNELIVLSGPDSKDLMVPEHRAAVLKQHPSTSSVTCIGEPCRARTFRRHQSGTMLKLELVGKGKSLCPGWTAVGTSWTLLRATWHITDAHVHVCVS